MAIFAASGSAMAAPPPNCPTQTGAGPGFIPVQTIKIFNDTAQQIYAELEVGKPNPDLWIQDVCNVPDAQKDKLYPYPTTLTNRFYINGLTGIPPDGNVTITLPLYTQLAATVVPTSNDQYAEWWQGQNMQIFAQPVGSGAPKAFQNYFNGTAPSRPAGSQMAMVFNASNPTKPTCTAGGTLNSCTLSFFTDTAGTLPNGEGFGSAALRRHPKFPIARTRCSNIRPRRNVGYWAVKPISRWQWNDGYGADCGPSQATSVGVLAAQMRRPPSRSAYVRFTSKPVKLIGF